MTNTIETLKVVCGPSISTSTTDEELLEQFLLTNESLAFTELMRRHGSMVFGVCRRILGKHQDAEDAFQAVFLVLAQKAASISPRRQLAAWLHGVASRTALKVRSQLQRHREALSTEIEAISQDQDPITTEWLNILDEELQKLPEKYRVPILLCALEGRSRREVAQILQRPEGTIAGQVRRGKQRLLERLAKRGVVLSLATITMELSRQSSWAKVSTSLLASTSHLVRVSRLGEVQFSFVHTLAEGVLQTMTMNKWKVAACWLAFISFIFGLGYMGPNLANAENQSSKSTKENQRDIEPINPQLVLNKDIQKELRLSQSQIDKCRAAWNDGKQSVKKQVAESEQIKKQIIELSKKIEQLRNRQYQVDDEVQKAQSKSLKKAIVNNFSNRAIGRLRQITLRQRNLTELLLDPKMQAKLGINDEQIKQLEQKQNVVRKYMIWDLDGTKLNLNAHSKADLHTIWWDAVTGKEVTRHPEVLKILNEAQRKTLDKILGEPFPRPSSNK